MLATADKNTEQAISSIWQLTEEEKIRDQIRYREEKEREHNHLIDKLKRLENQVAENEIIMAEKDNRIAEKDNRIAELEKMVADLNRLNNGDN